MGSPGDTLNMDTGNMDLRLIEARETYREQFADNDWANFLIASYKINESDECNIDIINKSGVKRDRLKATITFLKNKFSEVYPKATEFLSPKISNVTKKELSLQFINFIKFSIPHNCLTCDLPYFPYIDDNHEFTEIRCFKCSLPAHSGCIKDEEVHLKRGIVFVCANCVTFKKKSNPSPTQDQNKQHPQDEKTQTPHPAKTSSESTTVSDSTSDSDAVIQKSRKKAKSDKSDSTSDSDMVIKKSRKKRTKSDKSDERTRSTNDKICRFFERGICRYGMSGTHKGKCKFSHPDICRKVLNHGTRGKFGCKGECNKWHPRLCYAALNKKECFNSSCSFWHIKGTKRSPETQTEDTQKTSEEKPQEETPNHFLGSVQSQVTQILQDQQEIFKRQMSQFVQQMQQEMRLLTAINHSQPKLPIQLMQQTPQVTLPTAPNLQQLRNQITTQHQ